MAKTQINQSMIEELAKTITLTVVSAITKAFECIGDNASSDKVALATTEKAPTKKEKTSKKDKKDENKAETKYQVSYIHPSDYLDAYAYRMFVANLLTEKSYENIRLCKDIEKRKKYLSSLRNKAQKYNASHPDAMVKRPTQQDVIDIFHRNGWKLTAKK
jgi:hypothetical protein